MSKFVILKTSWGIVIFYEIEEIFIFNKSDIDILEILPQVFIKLNDINFDNQSLDYLKMGVKSIKQYIKTLPICFSIKKIDYSICDYQPEGMYYMFRKWFFENHNMEVPIINVYYNKELNKYIFSDLEPV